MRSKTKDTGWKVGIEEHKIFRRMKGCSKRDRIEAATECEERDAYSKIRSRFGIKRVQIKSSEKI